jgi:hypothetical protein
MKDNTMKKLSALLTVSLLLVVHGSAEATPKTRLAADAPYCVVPGDPMDYPAGSRICAGGKYMVCSGGTWHLTNDAC